MNKKFDREAHLKNLLKMARDFEKKKTVKKVKIGRANFEIEEIDPFK